MGKKSLINARLSASGDNGMEDSGANKLVDSSFVEVKAGGFKWDDFKDKGGVDGPFTRWTKVSNHYTPEYNILISKIGFNLPDELKKKMAEYTMIWILILNENAYNAFLINNGFK
jgi:hypothetical protein